MKMKTYFQYCTFWAVLLLYSISSAQTYSDLRVEGQTQHAPDTSPSETIASLLTSARALQQLGSIPAAILAYQQVIQLDPKNEVARSELAKIALEIKNWAYAIRMFDELAALRPNDIESREMLLKLYDIFEIPIARLKTARELMALSPDDTLRLHKIATLYHKQELYLEEIKVLERLIELAPNRSSYYWQLGALYARQKDRARQAIIYDKLKQLEAGNLQALKKLAFLYGAIGEIAQQIDCYQHILVLEADNVPVTRALIAAYRESIDGPLMPFNLKYARRQTNRYLARHPAEASSREVARALGYAAHPALNVEILQHDYDFSGKIGYLENKLALTVAGPYPNSRLTALNNYALFNVTGNTNRRADITTNEACVNDCRLGWEHKLHHFHYTVQAGVMKVLSALTEDGHYPPNFVANFQWDYALAPQFVLNGGYDLNYLTWTLEAIQQNIACQQVGLGFSYSPAERFSIRAQSQWQFFSDANRSRQLGLDLEYYLFDRPLKIKDLEAEPQIGFNATGLQITLGAGYEYLNYDAERVLYPTTLSEHFYQFLMTGEWQAVPSFFLKTAGFAGVNNAHQNIWGYHFEIRKQFNWLMHLTMGYENYRSPYVLNDVHFVNAERRFYLKATAGF